MDPGNTNWQQGPDRLTLPTWPCGIQSSPMGKLVLVAPSDPGDEGDDDTEQAA